jgi:hypothetical protein
MTLQAQLDAFKADFEAGRADPRHAPQEITGHLEVPFRVWANEPTSLMVCAMQPLDASMTPLDNRRDAFCDCPKNCGERTQRLGEDHAPRRTERLTR